MFAAPVPADLLWRKSTRSAANGNCVEVALTPNSVAVRDSKDLDGPVLQFGAQEWRDFVKSVRLCAFDRE